MTIYPPGVVFQRPYASDDGAIAGLDDAIAEARRAPGDPGPTTPAPTRRCCAPWSRFCSPSIGADSMAPKRMYKIWYRKR